MTQTPECNCQKSAKGAVLVVLQDKAGEIMDYIRADCPVHGLYDTEDGKLTWDWRRTAVPPPVPKEPEMVWEAGRYSFLDN